ncbi:two-component sensor histidine kinase [Lachnospiraceae bacterium KM106-2]|nr:two-component sensor histidine kinase [Lachnospiraceae bacterium KM106-2]
MRCVKEKLKNSEIRTKILFLYVTALILTLCVAIGIFSFIYEHNTKIEVGEAGVQTMNALNGNLEVIFDNVTQFSNLIYFDKDIQTSLSKLQKNEMDASVLHNIQKSLSNMILSGKYISSVFIFDQYNNYYRSYKVGPIHVDKDQLKQTAWYQRMIQANGDGFFIHKCESVLKFPTRPKRNYISYVREIMDVNDYRHLASLLITIDESTIRDYFTEVSKENSSTFCIVDSKGDFIIPPEENSKEIRENLSSIKKEEIGYKTVGLPDRDAVLVHKKMQYNDWTIVGLMNITTQEKVRENYVTTVVIVAIVTTLFMVVCTIAMTKMIFWPLKKVQLHMKKVEAGKFQKIEISGSHKNEINQLKIGFNHMVYSLEELIEKVKYEEKIIAKGELDLIQAQINPHFLYNTLDAASALALIEDNENCFKIIQALGRFYRNSLNSGKDVISVEDEIDCIQSYLTILNIRYENRIQVTYDIEEEIKPLNMLKLILQPIVENAVYHGIKEREGKGHITIKGYRDEDEIIFIVSDDGQGMSQECIERILKGKTQTGKSGFGLYSLIQRISLFYNIIDPLTITSEVGTGTEIIIRVKVIRGDGADGTEGIGR